MKQYKMVSIVIVAFLLVLGCAGVNQQQSGMEDFQEELSLDMEFQVDPDIAIGTLENGLKYYIRTNQVPEDRAELRLVVNAGSVLESQTQQGLAHFVEHMAFNGTENFERQEIVNYLESIGMQFGPEVNAYTSFDETVYMLQLPTDSTEIMETGFQILEEWAHNVAFDSVEIEKERGVIREEWRLGRGAQARMQDEQLPVLFHGSKYAERLPIGQIAVIDTFHHRTLTDYYNTWYRPDLMSVIAVGDFDPDYIKSLINKYFSRLSEPYRPEERELYPVPDHEETLFAIASDPEATMSSVSVYYKHDVVEENTVSDYRQMLVGALYNRMLNQRLNEITQEANPPFVSAYSQKGQLIRTKEVYVLGATVRQNGIERGLSALLTEAERVEQHGFTESELERAKSAMLRTMEQMYNERTKTRSSRYASEYIRNFLYQEPIPGIEFEYQIYQQFIPTITLEEIESLGSDWITDNNRVILASMPEQDNIEIPTEEDLLAVMQTVRETPVVAYQDSMGVQQLMSTRPAPSPVVSENYIDTLNVTEWTLENGIRVIMKPTDFKNDEIQFSAFSPGGLSLIADSNYVAGQTATSVVTSAGVDGISRVDLQKLLSDKVARVQPYIGEVQEGFSGNASPEDIETMFQLIYLYATAPREDSTAFLSFKSQMEAFLENRSASPQAAFTDTVQTALFRNHPRAQPWNAEMLEEMDMEESYEIYRERFAEAGDFTFVFVGNFTPEELKPLVETYLGALPDLPGEETWQDSGLRYVDDVVKKVVYRGLEEQSRVQLFYTGQFEYTRENRLLVNTMVDVLRIKLREVLREDMGGTYGVSIGASMSRRPVEDYYINISFGCDPERAEDLTQAVFQQIDSLKNYGIGEDYLDKVKEQDLRSFETNLRENGFWLSNLEFYYDQGQDPRLILKYPDIITSFTVEDLQRAARQYFNNERYLLAILYPEDYQS